MEIDEKTIFTIIDFLEEKGYAFYPDETKEKTKQ